MFVKTQWQHRHSRDFCQVSEIGRLLLIIIRITYDFYSVVSISIVERFHFQLIFDQHETASSYHRFPQRRVLRETKISFPV